MADFDITDVVADMYSGQAENNGFMIITDSPRADQAASSDWWGGLWTYWHSSESSEESKRPKLTIEYTLGTGIINAQAAIQKSIIAQNINKKLRLTMSSLVYFIRCNVMLYYLICD